MNIREFHFPEDYPPTLSLWENIEMGVKVGRSDSIEEIEKKSNAIPTCSWWQNQMKKLLAVSSAATMGGAG